MTLSLWAIRHPFLPLLAITLCSLLGLLSLAEMPLRHLPALGHDTVTAQITAPGLTLAETDITLAQPAEAALGTLPGVTRAHSDIIAGRLILTLSLADPAHAEAVKASLRDRLGSVQGRLPIATDPAIITAHSSRGQAATRVALTPGPGGMALIDQTLLPVLQRLPGVDTVTADGLTQPEIAIRPDPLRLAELGLTAGDLHRQITARLATGGLGAASGTPGLSLTVTDWTGSTDLRALPITLAGGRSIPLAELATLTNIDAPQTSRARLNGQPAVILTVHPDSHADLPALLDAVSETTARFAAAHPGHNARLIDRQADTVTAALRGTGLALLEGALLVLATVWLALRSARATAIAALALPLSILPTFLAMDLLGFSLNIISLLAITLAAGILVDDAIVEVENIQTHLATGDSPWTATVKATRNIGLAVVATTLAIVAVFLPVTLLPGMAGRYFLEFGGTLSIAALVSLFVARCVIPPIAARWIVGPFATTPPRTQATNARYSRLLSLGLRHPLLGVTLTLALILASVIAVFRQPGDFIPPEDTGRLTIALDLPATTTPATAEARLDAITASLATIDGVTDITAILPDATTPTATLIVELSPRANRSQPQSAIAARIDAHLAAEADLRHRILTQTGRAPAELVLAGTDPAGLDEAASAIAHHLQGSLSSLATDAPLRAERTQAIDPIAAARAGVTRASAVDELRLFGRDAPALATLAGPDGRPVTLRLDLAASAIPLTALHSDTGASVPLAAISHASLALVPARIERQDGLTLRRLTAAPAPGETAADASRRLAAARTERAPDVTPLAAGDAAQRAEMMGALKQAMLAGLLLLAAMLYALYRSVGQTLVILATLPLALGGALIGLGLTGQGLSLPVILAMLLLLGIVAKNAILIIDAAQSAIATGTAPEPALIAACQSRARPVVMTSLAIIGGMLPAAMGLGAGAGFRQPLAIAVISGITVGTALSLFVVPILSLQAHRSAAILALLTRHFGHSANGNTAHAP